MDIDDRCTMGTVTGISLSVDIGSVRVRAVCRLRSGPTMPLFFDEHPFLPADVRIGRDGEMVTGIAAETAAAGGGGGLVAAPITSVGEAPQMVDGQEIDVFAVIAAVIGRCVRESQLASGESVDELRLAVPPWWGPVRCNRLRTAAGRGGFAAVQLVDAAVAAAIYATRTVGVSVPVDGLLMVGDLGASGITMSVLRRLGDLGWDVLSTITRPSAVAVEAVRAAPDTDMRGAGNVASVLAVDQPTRQPAIAPPRQQAHTLNGAAPDAAMADAARCAQVVQAVVEAIDAVEPHVDAAMVTALVTVGGGAQLPGLEQAVTSMVGIPASVLPRPEQAVVLGCAYAPRDGGDVAADAWAPISAADVRMSQTVALGAAAAGSLFLLIHALSSAYVNHVGQYVDYVLFNNGEFSLACLLAVIAALTAGRGFLLIRVAVLAGRRIADPRARPQRLIAAAAGVGVGVCVIYALLAALTVPEPVGVFLWLAVWAVVPIVVLAGWITIILPRLAYLGGGVLRQLATPIVAIVLGCAGVAAVEFAESTTALSPTMIEVVARCGGAVAGTACAWLLTRARLARLIAVALAATAGALAAGVSTTSLFGYAFVVCADVWWLIQTISVTGDAFPRLRTSWWSHSSTRSAGAPSLNGVVALADGKSWPVQAADDPLLDLTDHGPDTEPAPPTSQPGYGNSAGA